MNEDGNATTITERQAVSLKLLLAVASIFGPPVGYLLLTLTNIRWEMRAIRSELNGHEALHAHPGSVEYVSLERYLELLQARNPEMDVPAFTPIWRR